MKIYYDKYFKDYCFLIDGKLLFIQEDTQTWFQWCFHIDDDFEFICEVTND